MRGKVKLKRIIFLVIILYFSYVYVNQQITMGRINKSIASSKEQFQKFSVERQQLEQKVEMSKTNKYTEKLAREKCNLVKSGEVPVVNSSSNK